MFLLLLPPFLLQLSFYKPSLRVVLLRDFYELGQDAGQFIGAITIFPLSLLTYILIFIDTFSEFYTCIIPLFLVVPPFQFPSLAALSPPSCSPALSLPPD